MFGYGLDFVFNRPLDGEKLSQAVHGYDAAGPGKIADALMKTAGIISSLCLVEIKTPRADLVEKHQHCPDCWQASRELSGGIAQSQKTVQKTIENGYRERAWETQAERIELAIPKLRKGSYLPSFLEPRRTAEKTLTAVIQEA